MPPAVVTVFPIVSVRAQLGNETGALHGPPRVYVMAGSRESASFGDHPVYEQYDNGADDGAYPARAFARLVESQCAAQIARDDGADDTQDDGQDNAQLLVARHD